MNIFWTAEAVAEVERPAERAEAFSSGAGLKLKRSISQRLRQLENFPYSGRVVPEYQARLLREIIDSPYRIIYEVFPDRVEVVTVRSGRQELPSGT